jgi:hypothetical protein
VVADEVRKLAERTSTATADISTLVTRIRDDSTRARDSMESLARRPAVQRPRPEGHRDMKLLMASPATWKA